MFSMLGKIFSSSQPQPVKENRSSDSDEESLANIDEEDENSKQMDGSDDRKGEESVDVISNEYAREEDAPRDGAVELLASGDSEETKQTPPTSKSKSRSKSKSKAKNSNGKRQEITESQDEVEYPGLDEIMEDDNVNSAPYKTIVQKDPQTDAPKKGRNSRKVNGISRRLTRASSQISEAEAQPAVPDDSVEEGEDLAVSLKRQRIQKSKSELSNPRRSKRITSTEPEAPNIVTRSRQSSVELAILPPKTKAARVKAQSAKFKSQRNIYDISEDENNVATVPLKPMAPPRTTQRPAKTQTTSQSDKDIPAASLAIEEVEHELPILPSNTSLGKRKASNSDPPSSSRKRKRKNDQAPAGTPQLSAFGFGDDSVISRSEGSGKKIVPNPTPQDLASTAQRLYAEAESETEYMPTPFSRPTDLPSSQLRHPTQWTPINSPEQVRESVKRQPLTSVSQPQVIVDGRVPSVKSLSPSPLPEAQLPPPKSSEKRKRRIPTGEPESTKSAKLTKPRGRGTVSKLPDLKKSTPKPRAPSIVQSTPTKSRVMNGDFDVILQAVESWMEEKTMTQYEVNDLVQKTVDGGSRPFWNHMAEQVPQIPRKKLQQICRRNFHNFEARGSWTEEQDDELRRQYELNPGKWKKIGELMNRFSEDCRDRWRNYAMCGDKQKKDAWDKEEEENLRVAVAECIEIVREDRKKDGNFKDSVVDEESLIDWKKVSEKMDYTRSRLQCLGKWKALKQRIESDVEDIVAEAPVSETAWRLEEAERQAKNMTAKQKLVLLYALRESGAGSEGKIPWVLIQKGDLHAIGKRMALKVCYRTLKQHIEGHEDMKFQEIIDNLIDAYEEAAPKEPNGFTKSFRSSQQSTLLRRSKTPQSLKHQKRKHKVVEGNSSDDNHEGPSTVKKSRLSSSWAGASGRKPIDNNSDRDGINTPRTSKPKVKAKPRINGPVKGKKADMMEEMENDGVSSSAPQPSSSAPQSKKKTLRHRMKPLQEKASQESAEDFHSPPVSDDLENLLGSLKTGKARTPTRGSGGVRRVQRLSDKYIRESDDEQETALGAASIDKSAEEDEVGSNSESESQNVVESQPEDEDESLASEDVLDQAERSSKVTQEDVDVVEESEAEATSESPVTEDEPELVEESLSEGGSQAKAEQDGIKESEDESQVGEEDSDAADASQSEDESEDDLSQSEGNSGNFDEVHRDVNGKKNYTSPGGPDMDEITSTSEDALLDDEMDSSVEEEEEELSATGADEEPTPTRYGKARGSVDLGADEDDEHKIIMNGWGNNTRAYEDGDAEEEEDDDEDDDEEDEPGRSPSKRLASPITFVDQNNTPRANGYVNGYVNGHSKNSHRALSVSSDDTSMSDIPSVVKPKLPQAKARETSLEL